MNVINYAYPEGTRGSVTVQADSNRREVRFTVLDGGIPFDPTTVLEADTTLDAQDRPIVFLLWGRPAQNKKPMLDNPRHLILEAPHPSPLSAYRGFFGCRHFSQAHEFLVFHEMEPIDWQIENKNSARP